MSVQLARALIRRATTGRLERMYARLAPQTAWLALAPVSRARARFVTWLAEELARRAQCPFSEN